MTWLEEQFSETEAALIGDLKSAQKAIDHRSGKGDAIRGYAERHHMEIVRTYSDAGKSGLKIEGRDALRQLIDDVEGGETDFDAILVYDNTP